MALNKLTSDALVDGTLDADAIGPASITTAKLHSNIISGQTAIGTVDATNDLLLIYDNNATSLKKVAVSSVGATNTDGLTEGSSNLYYTNARADARITNAIKDEDNMASNSATHIPSQQSVKAYVDTEVAGLVASAPGTLDTLNELAAALGDDANFSTTVTNSIATKLPLAGGTLTGTLSAPLVSVSTSAAKVAEFNSTHTNHSYIVLKEDGADKFYVGASTAVSGQSGAYTFYASSGIGLDFNTGGVGSPRMRIDSSGNVGIGTTTPGAPLVVEGSSFTNDDAIRITRTGETNFGIQPKADGVIDFLANRIDGTSAHGSYNFNTRDGGSTVTRMTITSSGSVGIGTTTNLQEPVVIYQDESDSYSATGYNDKQTLTLKSPNLQNNYTSIRFSNSIGNYEQMFGTVQVSSDSAEFVWQGYDRGGSAYKEWMRLSDNGSLGIGTQSPVTYAGTNGGLVIYRPGGSGNAMLNCVNTTGSGTMRQIDFFQGTSTSRIGAIESTTTFTNYNTTSDRRLKENIIPIQDATDKILAMNPVSHTWINDKTAPAQHGFIAQEMQSIVPEAVSGDADGEEMMQMDYGKITPVIVKSLQDALNEISSLKQRISKLEENQ